MLEKDIQLWLEGVVERGELADIVDGADELRHIAEAADEPFRIPMFSVDYVGRKRYAVGGAAVLDALSPVELVVADEDVSATKGEHMRPDLVIFNEEMGSFLLVELKRDGQTARQAMTELLAYEQELQNHFPFLSNSNVGFVLVSPEWTTLMDHAVFSEVMWGRRRVLALELTGDPGAWRLRVRIPRAWELLWSQSLPPDALAVTTVSLDRSEDDGEGVPGVLLAAADLVRADAEADRGHGFVLVGREWSRGRGAWSLTVATVRPFAFLPQALTVGAALRESGLVSFLQNSDPGSVAPRYALPVRAGWMLQDRWDVTVEAPAGWDETYARMRLEVEPLYVYSWGAIGDFARDFGSHPLVRHRYLPYVHYHGVDWASPMVALPVVQDLTGNRPFKTGLIVASECFEAGVRVGAWEYVYRCRAAAKKPLGGLDLLAVWLSLELTVLIAEVYWLHSTYHGVEKPPLMKLGNALSDEKRRKNVSQFAEWFRTHFLPDPYGPHRAMFDAGRACAPAFDLGVGRYTNAAGKTEKHVRSAAAMIQETLGQAFVRFRDMLDEGTDQPGQKERFDYLWAGYGDELADLADDEAILSRLRDDSLVARARDVRTGLLPFLDAVLRPVSHPLNPPVFGTTDWEWLRREVDRLRGEGREHPVVVVDIDGTLATMIHEGPTTQLDDPATHVHLLERLGATDRIRTVAWADLASGAAFSPDHYPTTLWDYDGSR